MATSRSQLQKCKQTAQSFRSICQWTWTAKHRATVCASLGSAAAGSEGQTETCKFLKTFRRKLFKTAIRIPLWIPCLLQICAQWKLRNSHPLQGHVLHCISEAVSGFSKLIRRQPILHQTRLWCHKLSQLKSGFITNIAEIIYRRRFPGRHRWEAGLNTHTHTHTPVHLFPNSWLTSSQRDPGHKCSFALDWQKVSDDLFPWKGKTLLRITNQETLPVPFTKSAGEDLVVQVLTSLKWTGIWPSPAIPF